MAVKKTTLPDGLRIVTERLNSVRSIAIGIWVDVGSRNERREECGASHLIEHMHFKGTSTRTAHVLADAIEQYGGALNAFTTREQTCYYARILDEHLPQAMDVLSDMLMHSTFTPANLKREKSVVLEEIKETEDTPAELVHDIFAEQFWGDHPLGRPILGTAEVISGMRRKTLLDYIQVHYTAPKVVISASGNLDHDELVTLVKERFKFSRAASPPLAPAIPPNAQRIHFVERDIAQNHFVLAFPSVEFAHKQRFAALGLNFYLGGGMSSVLFQEIRERRGLAYSVYSFQDFYRDSGAFGIYLSTDGRSLPLALKVIHQRLKRLTRKPLSDAELNKIKAQIKGSLTFSMESVTGRMNRLARHEMMLGKHSTLKQAFKFVDELTPGSIRDAARLIYDPERMVAVSLGPVTEAQLPELQAA
ncbi:MAG TPA: pitrilysin family protein [candidate division Zixibacteria bacterium]|nr:pitrilysin family protein [candidate division Zixibacteria bacterium]